jgi:hypothetical protein
MFSRWALRIALLALAATSAVFAQPSFSYGIIDASGNTSTLATGATIGFPPTAVSSSSSVNVVISNLGTQPGIINGVSVTPLAFQLSQAPLPGTSLAAGANITFTIKFAPTAVGAVSGTVNIQSPIGSVSFILSGTGLGSVFTYQVQNSPIAPLGTISFPNTPVNQSSQLTVQVTNTGSQPGQITSIATLGAGFTLSNSPFLPVTIPPNGSVSFIVVFTPSQPGLAQGRLQVGTDNFNLSGTGNGPALVYSYLTAGTSVSVQNNGVVVFSPTALGAIGSTTFSITNQGTTSGVVTSIGIGGANSVYTLPNLPPLPLALAAGAAISFTINFTPTAVGVTNGNLLIDAQTFVLSGSGTAGGASISYSYTNTGTSTPVQSGGTVVFSPTPIGSTATISFTINNQGNASTTIGSIYVGSTATGFNVSGLPTLPLTLGAGNSTSFAITFSPNTVGVATAGLTIDTASFSLTGPGTPPPALPTYSFTGASGTQAPMTQPAIGLSLSSAYGLPVSGTLTITFVSSVFVDDPTIQFSTGSRTVAFTIPANSTAAIFPSGSKQIQLATGSVAGTITIVPSFGTVGGVGLTPDSPTTIQLILAKIPPVLLSLQATSSATNTISLNLTGMATGRDLTQISFHFTMASGITLTIPDVNLNVAQAFSSWYQSTSSQASGSLFTVTVPFTLNGSIQNVTNLLQAIQSISVTLTNNEGVSNSLTAQFQ